MPVVSSTITVTVPRDETCPAVFATVYVKISLPMKFPTGEYAYVPPPTGTSNPCGGSLTIATEFASIDDDPDACCANGMYTASLYSLSTDVLKLPAVNDSNRRVSSVSHNRCLVVFFHFSGVPEGPSSNVN